MPSRHHGDATLEAAGDLELVAGLVGAAGLGSVVVRAVTQVRQGAYKLVCCDGDPDQLYDLQTDPLELVNLAGSPDHEQILRRLRAEVARPWHLAELREQVLHSQRQRRLVSRALSAGAHAAWDFQPLMDGAMRYVRSRTDLYELQRRARLDSPSPPDDRTSAPT